MDPHDHMDHPPKEPPRYTGYIDGVPQRINGIDGLIIGIEWRGGIDPVVAVAVRYERYWKAYIGGYNPVIGKTAAVARCIHHGAKLLEAEAIAFFPDGADQAVPYKTPERTS